MPVSVVVGGQYGSEGKGKVALEMVRQDPLITHVVRPGGTNSGHTGYSLDHQRIVLRQLPAAAVDGGVRVVLPPGTYIDPIVLQKEIATLRLTPGRVLIDPRAQVIRPEHIEWEREANLTSSIGSTSSGTGAAVLSRIARFAPQIPEAISAADVDEFQPFLADTLTLMRAALKRRERILIEGTQGFGLSPLHGDSWPKATSRDTTAAAFVSEAGLSPLDVDEVVLVIRAHPIRVAGDSGPLFRETSWEEIAARAGAPADLTEFTTVTQRVRRVGEFCPELVERAIAANQPSRVVLNHLDYVDWEARAGVTDRVKRFVEDVAASIGRSVDLVGISESLLVEAPGRRVSAA